MADTRRFQGATTEERLVQSQIYALDGIQTRHGINTENDTDKAIPFSLIKSGYVGKCESLSNEINKVVTITNFPDFQLQNGIEVAVYFVNGNSATNPTFNVNSTGAKVAKLENQAADVSIGSGAWGSGVWLTLKYQKVTISDTDYEAWVIKGHVEAEKDTDYNTNADGTQVFDVTQTETKIEEKVGNIGVYANGGAICSTAIGTANKTIELEDFSLYAGVTVKVLFTAGNNAANPTLNVNNTGAKAIKVVYGGEKITPINHTGYWRGAVTASEEMWQPYTILELMYDGTDWVIFGNPTVESWRASDGSSSYTIKADGLIRQRLIYDSGSNNTNVSHTFNFPIVFSDINYYFNFMSNKSGGNGYIGYIGTTDRTVTSITGQWYQATPSDYTRYLNVICEGY